MNLLQERERPTPANSAIQAAIRVEKQNLPVVIATLLGDYRRINISAAKQLERENRGDSNTAAAE